MILKNIAHQAVVRGHSVRFATASDMLADLAAQESSAALARRLRRYTVPARPALRRRGRLRLVRQSLRRPAFRGRHAPLRRQQAAPAHHEQGFHRVEPGVPHAACVVTLVDRLIHRAEVIEDRGWQLPHQGGEGAERCPLEAAPHSQALTRSPGIFTGTTCALHRHRPRFSPARPPVFIGTARGLHRQLHRISAGSREHQQSTRRRRVLRPGARRDPDPPPPEDPTELAPLGL
jgi:hypothetical protein